MQILAWSVYGSKDFAETKTVTGDLCAPDPEYSQQGPDQYLGPGLSRTVKHNGDCISEPEPEAATKNRSTNFHRRPSRRLPRPRQRALVDTHKPNEQPRTVNPSFPVLPPDRRDRHPCNNPPRVRTGRAHPHPAHPIRSCPDRNLATPHSLGAAPRHMVQPRKSR